MRTTAALLLVFGALIGCRKEEATYPDAAVITRLVILETHMLDDYYSGEKERAEKALISYLRETAHPKAVVITDEGRRMLHEHRAINMARLAFLRRGADFESELKAAASEMRLAHSANAALLEPDLVKALRTIVSDDAVPWILKKE